ncbi:Uncharacterised protein [Mycobacteroides abscessus subsp. abscessus]|nr:Uncharacterised protein [Mycobacteroides abscessus subsp. abscessus]
MFPITGTSGRGTGSPANTLRSDAALTVRPSAKETTPDPGIRSANTMARPVTSLSACATPIRVGMVAATRPCSMWATRPASQRIPAR